jgi:hypothetical protein
MGKLLSSYYKLLHDEIRNSISSNTSQYYAFAANPVEYANGVPNVANTDYGTVFENNWLMLFGKKLTVNDIAPVISKNIWTSNTIYNRYDNTSSNLSNFYVISEPSDVGGNYNIYKCIDNANGASSTIDPASIATPTQTSTFQTDDDYKWKYITSISYKNYEKFSSDDYVPVFTNTSLSVTASSRSGVDVVMITNTGSGYETYHSGNVLSVNSSSNGYIIQIENTAQAINDYYVRNSIYIYNTADSSTAQLADVTDYVANSQGNWIYVANNSVNVATITSGVSKYKISPKVVFESDGDSQPSAYSVINSGDGNTISQIVMLDSGSNISWCNVSIQSNTTFGSGANVYAIVPPAGGHGYDPITELDVQGLAINFRFANTESNNIVTSNIVFNKVGILKNANELVANVTTGSISYGDRYYLNTFDQILKANVSMANTFTVGSLVTGNTSGAKGVVVFSNTSQLYLTGDKHFIDGEYIKNSSNVSVTSITINEVGDIYTKNLKPIYVENINNINRSDEQSEEFKLIIKN